MDFLDLKTLEKINREVNKLFDLVLLSFIGYKPSSKKKKNIIFTSKGGALASLFVQALGGRTPSQEEKEKLKIMMVKASGYIEALRDRTKSNLANTIEGLAASGVSQEDAIKEIAKQFEKTKTHLNLIVNSESKTVRNFATAMQIEKVGKSIGMEDPHVFYNVTYDDRTAEEPEKNIHLIKGTTIPRVWKLSEMNHDFWKKGDKVPSLMGGHCFCRCHLTMLPLGYSFDENGKLIYKEEGWDELKYQREKYGLP